MLLFQYDHCPFCVRADMIARYKVPSYQPIYVDNDDFDTCVSRIGKKLVPILEIDGESMGESLDIAKRLDQLGDSSKVVREGGDAARFTSIIDAANFSIMCLLFPRNIAIGLPEFHTQSARDFFEMNKSKIIDMSFAEALNQTAEHIAVVQQALHKLPELELPSEHQGTISWDDVLIFPNLRNLTMVKGLEFPEQVRTYVDEVAAITGVELYFTKAI